MMDYMALLMYFVIGQFTFNIFALLLLIYISVSIQPVIKEKCESEVEDVDDDTTTTTTEEEEEDKIESANNDDEVGCPLSRFEDKILVNDDIFKRDENNKILRIKEPIKITEEELKSVDGLTIIARTINYNFADNELHKIKIMTEDDRNKFIEDMILKVYYDYDVNYYDLLLDKIEELFKLDDKEFNIIIQKTK